MDARQLKAGPRVAGEGPLQHEALVPPGVDGFVDAGCAHVLEARVQVLIPVVDGLGEEGRDRARGGNSGRPPRRGRPGAVSSPRVRAPLERPRTEPRCTVASPPHPERAAVPWRSRTGQAHHRFPSGATGTDFPALGHRLLHLRIHGRKRLGLAGRPAIPLHPGQPGGFAVFSSSHRMVLLLRLREIPGREIVGAGSGIPALRSETLQAGASRGTAQDALRIGIVWAFASGAFGMCTWSTPLSKVAVTAFAEMVPGRRKERWKR